MNGAKSATPRIPRTIRLPARASGFGFKSRTVSTVLRARARSVLVSEDSWIAMHLLQRHARIHVSVRDVDDEVDRDVDQAREQRQSCHRGVVKSQDRPRGPQAEPRVPEDAL